MNTTLSASSVKQLPLLPVSATTTPITTNTTTSEDTNNTTNSNRKVGISSSSSVTPRRLTRGRTAAEGVEEADAACAGKAYAMLILYTLYYIHTITALYLKRITCIL